MSDVIDVICTLLLRKYPSIDAVYEYSVPWVAADLGGRYMGLHSQRILVEAAYNGVIRREESSLRRIPH